MTCTRCNHTTCKRFGYFGKRRIQRWRCTSCRATFADPTAPKLLGTHYTDPAKLVQALTLMLEGMSIRAISRVTGLHKGTILSLLETAGQNCRRLWGLAHSWDADSVCAGRRNLEFLRLP